MGKELSVMRVVSVDEMRAIERREPWGVWGGQLFFNGKVLAFKRKRGRPPKNQAAQLTA